jgi:hypothetical protein
LRAAVKYATTSTVTSWGVAVARIRANP